jgi:hypothetical protein
MDFLYGLRKCFFLSCHTPYRVKAIVEGFGRVLLEFVEDSPAVIGFGLYFFACPTIAGDDRS